MAVTSRTYPLFEFRRKPKGKRPRRIHVVSGGDSVLWYPETVEYSSRVKLDGGKVESLGCVNDVIREMSKPRGYSIYTVEYESRVLTDGGIVESLGCVNDVIIKLLR